MRLRAVALLGEVADSAATASAVRELEGALAEPATRAAARIEARARVLAATAPIAAALDGPEMEAAVQRAVPLLGDSLLVGELADLVRDPFEQDPGRGRALVALLARGSSQDGRVEPALRDAFVAVEVAPEVRTAALEALALRNDPDALAAGVSQLLRAGDALGARLAERGVRALSPEEGVLALCRRLTQDAPDGARLLAARALGREGRARAIPWLRAQGRDPALTTPGVWCAAQVALLRLREALSDETLQGLLDLAASRGPEAVEAVEGLALVPPARLEGPLATLVADPDVERRVRAIQLVHALRIPSLAPAVAQVATSNEQPFTARLAAAHALGALDCPRAAEALAALLAEREDPQDGRAAGAAVLRASAADGLANQSAHGDAACAALVDALQDPGPGVRIAALRAVAAWADPRLAGALRAVLDVPARSTAERLARVLAFERLRLSDAATATRLLRARQEDPDAGLSLALVGYARGADLLAAGPALIELLGHRAPEVREAAHRELRRRARTPTPPFDPAAPPSSFAVEAWRAWWERRPR